MRLRRNKLPSRSQAGRVARTDRLSRDEGRRDVTDAVVAGARVTRVGRASDGLSSVAGAARVRTIRTTGSKSES